jgi:hypothetical protein
MGIEIAQVSFIFSFRLDVGPNRPISLSVRQSTKSAWTIPVWLQLQHHLLKQTATCMMPPTVNTRDSQLTRIFDPDVYRGP